MPTFKPEHTEVVPKSSLPLTKMEDIYQQAPPEWKEVLELICSEVLKTGTIDKIYPNCDQERIESFFKQV